MPGAFRPKAFILTVGNELLHGSVLNTNARFLGASLSGIGFSVTGQGSCPDELAAIKSSLDQAMAQADFVVLTGGLGPTPDDLTRDALAEYFQSPLCFSPRQYRFIERYYRKRGARPPAMVRKEAMFPQNAVPLFNRHGIALGFYIRRGAKCVAVLPGVPAELEKMHVELLEPLLKKFFSSLPRRYALVVKCVGIGEPEVMARLGKDFFRDPVEFGIYPETAEITLRLYADKPSIIARLKRLTAKRLKGFLYAFGETSLSEVLGQNLAPQSLSLALAESCSGGALASEIVKTPGASRYFQGGVVSYSNKSKEQILGVPGGLLKKYGAVSVPVARRMAEEVRRRFSASLGLAVTGIAGPGGKGPAKPAGLVYIAIAGARRCRVWREQFTGDRNRIREKTVKRGLEYLWRWSGAKVFDPSV